MGIGKGIGMSKVDFKKELKYLSDPRRVAPENLKTVLRQPVRRVQTS